jgi:hypothetical protein
MKNEAETPVEAVISPTTLSVSPSKVRPLSHLRVLASPPVSITIPLVSGLETRGTLITCAPSDVLRLPDKIESAGRVTCVVKRLGRRTVPDKLLYAIC